MEIKYQVTRRHQARQGDDRQQFYYLLSSLSDYNLAKC